MTAVTFGSLCSRVDDSRLTSAAIALLSSTFWCGLETVTVIKGIAASFLSVNPFLEIIIYKRNV